jgi:hypothetical protein
MAMNRSKDITYQPMGLRSGTAILMACRPDRLASFVTRKGIQTLRTFTRTGGGSDMKAVPTRRITISIILGRTGTLWADAAASIFGG